MALASGVAVLNSCGACGLHSLSADAFGGFWGRNMDGRYWFVSWAGGDGSVEGDEVGQLGKVECVCGDKVAAGGEGGFGQCFGGVFHG